MIKALFFFQDEFEGLKVLVQVTGGDPRRDASARGYIVWPDRGAVGGRVRILSLPKFDPYTDWRPIAEHPDGERLAREAERLVRQEVERDATQDG